MREVFHQDFSEGVEMFFPASHNEIEGQCLYLEAYLGERKYPVLLLLWIADIQLHFYVVEGCVWHPLCLNVCFFIHPLILQVSSVLR